MIALQTTQIRISQRGDPRVAPYVSIRERDLTGGSDGRFIVEGKVPLAILLRQSRFQLESLFLCESRLGPLAGLLAEVPAEIPVYVAPQGVLDEIAGFHVHRGVLACAFKGPGLELSEVLAAPAETVQTVLVLNQISNHDNVGAAFRNAAAFGVDAVLLDRQSCDPLYRKAIRVSSGTSLWLPYVQQGAGSDHITELQSAGFTVWAMTPRLEARPLNSLTIPDKVALVLGAEGPGLSDTLISAAQPVRIAMRAGFDSVNVATAGAIALAHIFARRAG